MKGAKLDHLCDALVSKLSIDDAFGLLDQGRPKLLDKLKELGVSKIPERQAFAKAIANGKRELVGAGLPVLVITYSTGLQPAEGRDLMKPIVEAAAAAGFVDSVVLDHCNEAPYKGTVSSNDEYARALRDTVYKAKEGYDGRPLVVVAHSNGTVGAYGLARLLGSKVRALCVLGRRPPSMPLLPDAIGVQTIAEVMALSAHDLAQRMSTAYDNAVLQGFTKNPDDSTWQPNIQRAVQISREQYGSPCVLCGAEEISAAICPPGADVPAAARVSAPIFGVASKLETAQGETADKMEGWAQLTASSFELTRDVDAKHMDLPAHPKTIDAVLAALTPHLLSK